jgi:hemerythrin-like domain-containing protein
VFDVLSKDHDEVKRMLTELEKGATATTGADQGQLARRKKIVEQLVIAESKHEAVEEMYFWPVVRERQPSGDTLAATAIGQEQEGKQALQLLDKAKADQPDFEDLLAKFTKAARDHIFFEETSVWPGLKAILSKEDAASLGQKLEAAKKIAPTRPHPKVPAQPGGLKGAGPLIGAADRLRDAAHGRGRD